MHSQRQGVYDYDRLHAAYANQTGPIAAASVMAIFWYNTAFGRLAGSQQLPHADESGWLVQLEIAETEIGQGADTVFAQMVADTVGVPFGRYTF
jgi:xanthine dehydrogenase molybdenum-binding subunit